MTSCFKSQSSWFTKGLVLFPLGVSSVEVGAGVFFVVGGVVSLRHVVLNFFLTQLVLEFLVTLERVGKVVAMGGGVVPLCGRHSCVVWQRRLAVLAVSTGTV